MTEPSDRHRVLVLFAHPALERSRINRQLLAAAQAVERVTVRDLYELYPDYDIDVVSEQDAVSAHDTIVFQHPFYWYSVPPLLKQWQDLVLQHGWAYGKTGTQLHGKRAMHVTTTGGLETAYTPTGHNRFSMTELLRPLEQTATLCGMKWLPPFIAHGTFHMTTGDVAAHGASYSRLLGALRDGTFDEGAAADVPRVNEDLDRLIAGGAG